MTQQPKDEAEGFHGSGLNGPLVLHRLSELEEWRREMTRVIASISETLTSIRILETEAISERKILRDVISHCTKSLEVVDTRVRVVEEGLPLLRMTSHWVVVGVMGVLGLLGVTIWHLIFKTGGG